MKKLFVMITAIVLGVLLAATVQAARNSGGTFTFTAPGGPVVTTGTTISSAWANGSLAEIQTALTDSLSRSGLGAMSTPLGLVDGTVALPATKFSSASSTGIYYTAGPTFNVSASGTQALACTSTGCSVPGTLGVTGALTAKTSVIVEDPGAGTNAVTVSAPSALAASYNVTLPAVLPASTLPVTLTSAGVLDTAQLVNSQQNFGTPSATTDVAIKSYVDSYTRGRPFAWARITTGATGAATVTASLNVSSASYSTNDLTINLTNAATSATSFACIVTGGPLDGTHVYYNPVTSTASSLHIIQKDSAGANVTYTAGFVYNIVLFQ